MAQYFFAQGKKCNGPENMSTKQWLEEMTVTTKLLIESGELKITELDVGDMKRYSTDQQKKAIKVLKETVQPQESCVLIIDEERFVFTIIRYLNGYVVTEKHDPYTKPNSSVCSVIKESNAKKTEIVYFYITAQKEITCKIKWAKYPKDLNIKVSHKYLQVVMEKRVEFENYVDSISPENINCADIFTILSKMLGTKSIQVYTGEYWSDEGCGVWGTDYGDVKVQRVIERHENYILIYDFGTVSCWIGAKGVRFPKPQDNFEKFEIILRVTGYDGVSQISSSAELDELVETAISKGKDFYNRVCKL